MNLTFGPHITNARTFAADLFQHQHDRAVLGSLWNRLFGKENLLPSLSKPAPQEIQQMNYMGLQDIQIKKIVGSMNRAEDFDTQFRPLKNHLRDRWVNIYLQLERGSCPAIQVVQVGDKYYVIDGHHRVSVANFIGEAFITAEVWQIQAKKVEAPSASRSKALQPATCC